MKLAITGKGGVGKTTLAALLAHLYAREGRPVLAIDADPDANLAGALGLSPEQAAAITPIAEMSDLIEERTGARPGESAPVFRMNPRVDDIPDRFAANVDGIKLLVLGAVTKGGGGCFCPESALLRTLVTHLILRRSEVVILDMEAGIEHLGRATAESVDAFIVVVEPGRRSLQTAEAIRHLAEDIGVRQCYVVGNKVQNEADREFIAGNLAGFTMLGFISYNPDVIAADRAGAAVFELGGPVEREARAIKDRLEMELAQRD